MLSPGRPPIAQRGQRSRCIETTCAARATSWHLWRRANSAKLGGRVPRSRNSVSTSRKPYVFLFEPSPGGWGPPGSGPHRGRGRGARRDRLSENGPLPGSHRPQATRRGEVRGKGAENMKAAADRFAANVLPLIQPLTVEGRSLREIAKALDARGVPTARGGKWAATQIADILKRGQ